MVGRDCGALGMMPLFDRRQQLLSLILDKKPNASRIAHVIELAHLIDPQMPLVEIRDVWTEFNRHHRRPRIGNPNIARER